MILQSFWRARSPKIVGRRELQATDQWRTIMDLASITFLFRVPDLAKSLGGYLGLVESIDKKLDKLLQSDFNAAVRCLRESLVATKQQDFLLHEAWRRFHTALTNETGERKALAYVGLALCQDRLGERECSLQTLSDFLSYGFAEEIQAEIQAITIKALAIRFIPIIGKSASLLYSTLQAPDCLMRKRKISELQEEARQLIAGENG